MVFDNLQQEAEEAIKELFEKVMKASSMTQVEREETLRMLEHYLKSHTTGVKKTLQNNINSLLA